MTIPCIDCLVFPMCLNRYRELRMADIKNKYEYPAMSKTVARNDLRERCKILDEHFKPELKTVYEKVQTFNKTFEHREWR